MVINRATITTARRAGLRQPSTGALPCVLFKTSMPDGVVEATGPEYIGRSGWGQACRHGRLTGSGPD